MQGKKLWWIPLPVVALDRLLKCLALRRLTGGHVSAISGVLSWQLTRNTGAAFSLFSDGSAFLTVLTALLIVGIAVYLFRSGNLPAPMCVGLWMIAGGGIGNLWDRLAYGSVIDFIRFDFIRFPIFNPADVFVCFGAGLTLLSVAIPRRREAAHD